MKERKQQRVRFPIANQRELIVTVNTTPYNVSIDDENALDKEVKGLVKLLYAEGSIPTFNQLVKEVNKAARATALNSDDKRTVCEVLTTDWVVDRIEQSMYFNEDGRLQRVKDVTEKLCGR